MDLSVTTCGTMLGTEHWSTSSDIQEMCHWGLQRQRWSARICWDAASASWGPLSCTRSCKQQGWPLIILLIVSDMENVLVLQRPHGGTSHNCLHLLILSLLLVCIINFFNLCKGVVGRYVWMGCYQFSSRNRLCSLNCVFILLMF